MSSVAICVRKKELSESMLIFIRLARRLLSVLLRSLPWNEVTIMRDAAIGHQGRDKDTPCCSMSERRKNTKTGISGLVMFPSSHTPRTG
jgi:hypothetical protein